MGLLYGRAWRLNSQKHRFPARAVRIFAPNFRGSTGSGDAFTAANVDCQGAGDLADITTGIEALEAAGVVARGVACGVYGGSYGGYMSFAAAAFSDRFAAAIPQFGFIANREMSLITGDYTYEEAYFSSRAAMAGSDIPLDRISCPTLLMHGLYDDACPVSHSQVAFRTLRAAGVEAELVLYPGEFHGWRRPANQLDGDQRVLRWFRKHLMPPARL
jgi:dipeptidyl aminopeptidase/acylaminoacyl peptidase